MIDDCTIRNLLKFEYVKQTKSLITELFKLPDRVFLVQKFECMLYYKK